MFVVAFYFLTSPFLWVVFSWAARGLGPRSFGYLSHLNYIELSGKTPRVRKSLIRSGTFLRPWLNQNLFHKVIPDKIGYPKGPCILRILRCSKTILLLVSSRTNDVSLAHTNDVSLAHPCALCFISHLNSWHNHHLPLPASGWPSSIFNFQP